MPPVPSVSSGTPGCRAGPSAPRQFGGGDTCDVHITASGI